MRLTWFWFGLVWFVDDGAIHEFIGSSFCCSGRFGLVDLVCLIWYERFVLAGLVWKGWLGRFSLGWSI